jgi:hypothetical protein
MQIAWIAEETPSQSVLATNCTTKRQWHSAQAKTCACQDLCCWPSFSTQFRQGAGCRRRRRSSSSSGHYPPSAAPVDTCHDTHPDASHTDDLPCLEVHACVQYTGSTTSVNHETLQHAPYCGSPVTSNCWLTPVLPARFMKACDQV